MTKFTIQKELVFTYLKGFAKGVGILALYFGVLFGYTLILLKINNVPLENLEVVTNFRYSLFAWLLGFLVIYYVVIKNKLSKSWLVIGIILTVYLIPFIMGNIELKKKNA